MYLPLQGSSMFPYFSEANLLEGIPIKSSKGTPQLLTFLSSWSTVPLRAPELSLTSSSPVDIQVSWQPLPDKLSRGRVSAYRLSYRTSAENAVSQVELPGEKTQHLLENLKPDTIYLLRIAAATTIGWGEQSAWTSHRTPKASSARGTTLQRVVLKCAGSLKK